MANTFGEKELRTDWDEQTAADSTKAVGHIKNLIPEKSYVPERKRVGLD